MGRTILSSTASSIIAQNDGFIRAKLCISVLCVLTDQSEHVSCTACVFVIVSECQCVHQHLQKGKCYHCSPPPQDAGITFFLCLQANGSLKTCFQCSSVNQAHLKLYMEFNNSEHPCYKQTLYKGSVTHCNVAISTTCTYNIFTKYNLH